MLMFIIKKGSTLTLVFEKVNNIQEMIFRFVIATDYHRAEKNGTII